MGAPLEAAKVLVLVAVTTLTISGWALYLDERPAFQIRATSSRCAESECGIDIELERSAASEKGNDLGSPWFLDSSDRFNTRSL